MKLEDFEFTDAKISGTTIDFNLKKMIIYFESAYEMNTREHIKNVVVIISEWEQFKIFKWVSFDNFKTYRKIDVLPQNVETFRLIQLKTIVKDELVFEGYSNESSFWLVYEFKNYIAEVS